jgi:steroid 5-alpha reductase family enzyme
MSTTTQDVRLTSTVLVVVLAITVSMVSATQGAAADFQGISMVAFSAILCFGIQMTAWVPASFLQTERFYDLTGGLTYIILAITTLMLGAKEEDPSTRELIVTVLVIIWAIRLSSFLFLRIHHAGKDGRFDDLKTSPVRFLIPWSLQGLWIFVTMNVVIVINSQSGTSPELTAWDAMGVVLWTAGFCVEVVADRQKSAFNAKPENEGRWIDEGLWSISRHPNYLGEILLWSGIALFGVPCFSGLEWAAWVSPVFVYLLLTKVSGVPILDRRGLEKWGEEPGYLEYRSTTPLLFPSLKRK